MTGGIVAILGATGKRLGAGMTGGFAYVMDKNEDFPRPSEQRVGWRRFLYLTYISTKNTAWLN
ncbi:hypothetical protein OK016_11960 [Vibrio chagasii]|nr:hypothetical protein [Vibrio chagasii]